MKLRYLPIFFCFIFPVLLIAQNSQSNWYFGVYAGMQFNGNTSVAALGSSMYAIEGSASISDNAGNLLFYTDGVNIWNKNHNTMSNGTGLYGHSSSAQSALIVPKPGSSGMYYIFTVDEGGYVSPPNNGLHFSVVDMSLNNGLGDVVSNAKNISLLASCAEKLTAVPHANLQDVWILVHAQNSNAFYAFLLSSGGVDTTAVVSSVGTSHNGSVTNTIGYMKASPNGNRIALACHGLGLFEIFDFNRSSGIVSNTLTLPYHNAAYGVAFSPDGTKLYGSTECYKTIYQWDLQAGSTAAVCSSELTIGSIPSAYGIGAMQLAADGKIYVAAGGRNYLGVINNPNNIGSACGFSANGFFLGGKTSYYGLPNFYHPERQEIEILTQNNCFGIQSNFQLSDSSLVDSVIWNFNDPASGSSNYSTSFQATHIFTSPGQYPVYLYAYNNGSPDTITDTIQVYPNPQLNLGPDTSMCSGNSMFLAPPQSFQTYTWSTGSTAAQLNIISQGLYWLHVTDQNGCTAVDTISVSFAPAPMVDLGKDTSICTGNKIVLDAGNNLTYQWSNGSIAANIMVQHPGCYWVKVTNTYGCESYDTVCITTHSGLQVDLGPDTMMCEGESIMIYAGTQFSGYTWNDGSSNTYNIFSSPGSKWIEVTDSLGCTSHDTVVISYRNTPQVDLGEDTILCPGENILISAGSFSQVEWNDGSQVLDKSIDQAGIYWVEVTDQYGCSATDSISIDFFPLIGLDFLRDTSICEGDAIILNMDAPSQSTFSDGGLKDLPYVISAQGWYWIDQNDSNGCFVRDSFYVNVLPKPELSLGEDLSLCYGEMTLINAGKDHFQYLWSTGETSSMIDVDQSGLYWVEVKNENGCFDRDTIEITFRQPPTPNLGGDVYISGDESVYLDADCNAEFYEWQDGSTNAYYYAYGPGTYYVIASNGNCSASDTIQIIEYAELWVPNAFTPDGDGLNDVFKPEGVALEEYHMQVFDRWGKLIFETNDITRGWDGKVNGSRLNTGVYSYLIYYKAQNLLITGGRERILKGTVTLMR